MHFLLKINGWVAFGLLVLSATIHWDRVILNYNLKHRQTVPVDVAFLLDMHPSVLPVLEANATVLSGVPGPQSRVVGPHVGGNWVNERLKREADWFLQTQSQYTWLSWNWADHRLKQYPQSKTPR
jgi:hypothetical protein